MEKDQQNQRDDLELEYKMAELKKMNAWAKSVEQSLAKTKHPPVRGQRLIVPKSQKINSASNGTSTSTRTSDLEEEMLSYIDRLSSIGYETPDETLKALLPPATNPNCKKILQRLELETKKNIRAASEMLEVAENAEDLRSLKGDLGLELRIQEAIQQRLSSIQMQTAPTTVSQEELSNQNKLIFIQDAMGNIPALEHLQQIPPEYYSKLSVIFRGLKNGTPSNVKFVNRGGTHPTQCITSGKDLRVAFIQISRDAYVILDIFIKSPDNSRAYKHLESIMGNYKRIEPKLKDAMYDESFLGQQAHLESRLWEILTPEQKGDDERYVKAKTAATTRPTK